MNPLPTLFAAILDNPDDTTAQGVYFDARQEAGKTPLAARRIVNRAVREGCAARDLLFARALVEAQTARGGRMRTRIRDVAGCGGSHAPITVVVGNQTPTRSGEEAHTTFRNGGRCNYPGAARRAGHKLDYHRSTLAVTVGAGWVLREAEGGGL